MRIYSPCRDAYNVHYEHKMLATKGKKFTSDNALTEPNDKADEINLETNLLYSATHIVMTRAQCTHTNECSRLVKQDNANNLYFYQCRCVITFNFAQNLGLLYFSDEQPGDTYYYSSLSLYIFGIINNALLKNHLHSYLCHEGEGKKSGVNVVSVVMDYV